MRRLLPAFLLAVALTGWQAAAAAAADWPTFHADNTRQGNDSGDTGLDSPASLWTAGPLDGQIYAQPLIVGGQVIVATENNSVYAFNAANGSEEWQTNLGTPRSSATLTCGDISPMGITSTPVVDGSNVYVVANVQLDTLHNYDYEFELASLSLATGATNWTANIDPPDNSNPSGTTWDQVAPAMEDRGALLVDAGRVFVPMGGNYGDCGAYHGYVVSFPETGSGSLDWWATSSVNAGDDEAAIWAAGGLSEDANGYLYAATGNSNHGRSTDPYDYSDSVIKLNPSSLGSPSHYSSPTAYFAPSDWYTDNANDADLGSTAPLQLPGGRVFQLGKSGIGYLLNTAALGGIGGQLAAHRVCNATNGAAFATLAYASGTVFAGCSDGLAAVRIAPSNDDFSTLWYNTSAPATHPPTVAGDLVWSVSSGGNQLLGFSVSTGQLLDTLAINASNHFTTPAAANDQLYVAGGKYVNAFVGTPPTASRYAPLTPYRVLDTRSATCVQSCGSLGQGQTRTIQVGGYTPTGYTGSVVPAGATAVVLNVTAVEGTAGTFLTLFPAGGGLPTVSNLNAAGGEIIPNLVTVRLGSSGGKPGYVSIHNARGSIDVVADVEGYYTATTGTSGEYHALPSPLRVCDTRANQGTACAGGTDQPIGPGQSLLAAVTGGSTGVSDSGHAAAVSLNLTAIRGTQGTYLTVYPPTPSGAGLTCGAPPLASTLNVGPGAIQPNRVVAPVVQLNGAGYVCVFNRAGSIDVALDVDGWFGDVSDTGGHLFYPLGPFRICDTRLTLGTQCAGGTLGPGGVLAVLIAGQGAVPSTGVVAVVANVTAVQGSSGTFLTVYPDASSRPGTSDLNASAGEIIPNSVMVGVASDGEIDVYNAAGSINVAIDLAGWFQ